MSVDGIIATDPHTGDIDWTQEQPAGVERCEFGYTVSGASHGCQARITTRLDNGQFCDAHALIDSLLEIKMALQDVGKDIEKFSDNLVQYVDDAPEPWWRRVLSAFWR